MLSALVPAVLVAMLLQGTDSAVHKTPPLRECDGWTPRYPVNAAYNTTFHGYADDVVNVHLIPHTHDDAGWLLTVDEYFTEQVDYILDTVLVELHKNPDRRFMYVEQAFLRRWWREQSNATKESFKQLVTNGQLDLSANGGWVMHDEATPHYTTLLDQTALGHKFLLDEFGVIPRIGWQIDPFGHSATQGSLLSSGIGFDALYFARMDYQDYAKRKLNKDLEFIWKPSPSRNESVFTGMIQENSYGAPPGFYFDENPPVKDDPYLHDYNVCDRVKSFVELSLQRAKYTKGNHIFWPMGEDFKFQNAVKWFKNLDKLIHYTNQEGRVNVFYSTLGNYTDVKLQDKSLQWTTKTDDFFPYADRANGYWNGYFTSRPALKRYIRVANSALQALRQLEVWHGSPVSSLNHLLASVSLTMHHDGITGTEKQAVAADYAQRLAEGLADGQDVLNSLLSNYASSPPWSFCLSANVSICGPTTTSTTTSTTTNFSFVVYNPLPVAHTFAITLPVTSSPSSTNDPLVVRLANGSIVPSAVVPSVPVYSGHSVVSTASHQLIVQAAIAPLTSQVYHVVAESSSETQNSNQVTKDALPSSSWSVVRGSVVTASNDFVQIQVDTATGSLVAITNKATHTSIKVHSGLFYYQAHATPGDPTNSGAYIFHPNTSTVHPLPSVTSFKCQKTTVLASCVFQFGRWGVLEYKLHPWNSSVQVEWTVGPIPVDDLQGKEVILRFDTSVASKKTWYTDSNGLEFIKRIRNHRDTWELNVNSAEEAIAANYVPMTLATYIRDTVSQFNVVTDRAQGVASLRDGSVEVMVHRRLLEDDHKGVNEHLNELETLSVGDNAVVIQGLTVRGSVALSVGPLDAAMERLRLDMYYRYLTPLVAVAHGHIVPSSSHDHHSWIDRLPLNVGLTSLEAHSPKCIRLRLTHLFAVDEHPVWSQPATVSLATLLGPSFESFSTVWEISLTGNRRSVGCWGLLRRRPR
ncbi:hypothetical protein H257_15245 [Aphanomyces astaci]|uniref:Alpha-mannosidase n=3 Tax=Aphanomyces astaci TaxID=112090 RepID=W4FPZ0_APHAT|nr:hypothetical protein H257_15245 [Aphanomyces astaci]ETV68894.1 hypothetical protein H257_15245 [Aphanomyces astaci]|eukprot:XP_009841571.1 hypothetical protein H257_15245 [Aphanomyces astaci]